MDCTSIFLAAAALAAPLVAGALDAAGQAGLERWLEKEARLELVLRLAMERNPDLRESRALTGAADARAEAAGHEPDFQQVGQAWEVPLSTPMVELDCGYMPMDGTSTYTAMVGFTLPWLTPGRGAAVREAERMVETDREALASARNQARYQIREAHAKVRAARDTYDLLAHQILPQSRLAADAAREAFAAGESTALGVLDSLRNLLGARLEQTRAQARAVQGLADLERASGQSLLPTPNATPRGTKP
ncbi:MAG TPA: TolC family protein [Anaeromyxobacteraceae bacterium]|nr:TolC family protein [Anaeromyxobacteraceae bacterium]